ncbi:MAG: phosphoribosylaminoimidazolecarboxamide formyltransferase [Clostridiales bacterium]|nr:phosphoribosylaminoimidazolecarboxamide formyltransferase [Clostridiales bacterium]
MVHKINLKYGCNPNQNHANITIDNTLLPFNIINGNPGYINLMDALNSWQLVKELKIATGLPAATSFKHVSPAGAAVGLPLNDILKKIYFVEDLDLSPVACAYARARGADRMSSFGDWIAISDIVDLPTAVLIKRSVSDGIIAPGYTEEALKLLLKKKNGQFNIIEMSWDYIPKSIERKDIYGITFEQQRNNLEITPELLNNPVTDNKTLSDEARIDMLIAMITLKYTQSNSVCFALYGQIIGVGAGQQSRIHCTRLAASKADNWFLRQHPKVLNLKFKEGISSPDKDNAINQFLLDELTDAEMNHWQNLFIEQPTRLSLTEKKEWLSNLKGVTLGSDAFIPFRDNIDRAVQSGVKYVVQAGGSKKDDDVIQACNEYDMTMLFTECRLFHH